MNTILVQNKWEENKLITKKDIINSNFECEIFINENKLLDSMTVKKINNICINFNKNYTDLSDMFKNCSSLTSINLSNFNTNNVTNMNCMFAGCISLTSINLSNFNCDKIENTNGMIDMFKDCKSLKIKNIEYIDFKIRSQIIIDLYIS